MGEYYYGEINKDGKPIGKGIYYNDNEQVFNEGIIYY